MHLRSQPSAQVLRRNTMLRKPHNSKHNKSADSKHNSKHSKSADSKHNKSADS